MKLTDPEWEIMDILWTGEAFSLGEVTRALAGITGWNKNTVFTYLSRMAGKGLVRIDRGREKPYSAAVCREDCAREERQKLLGRLYRGAVGDLVSAFLTESQLSAEEIGKLRRLLDEMEV